jgi:hypothetical protein
MMISPPQPASPPGSSKRNKKAADNGLGINWTFAPSCSPTGHPGEIVGGNDLHQARKRGNPEQVFAYLAGVDVGILKKRIKS